MEYKTINVGHGRMTKVSPGDFDWLNSYSWCFGNTYVHTRKLGSMHRTIMKRVLGRDLSRKELVDHINRDRLDNRRANLRLASDLESARNTAPWAAGKSKFKGVFWHSQNKYWHAAITHERQYIHLGCFNSELDAAVAYDQAAIQLFDDFAYLNVL